MVIEELLKELQTRGLNMGIIDDKHLPDKEWALEVLGTLNPDHEFFRRDYQPPPKPGRREKKLDAPVDNFDGLFDHA